MFSVITALYYSWFKNFKALNYQLNKFMWIYLGIIAGLSALLGFIFYGVASIKLHIIWTTFLILSVDAATFLVFIGTYIKNDFCLYS